MLMERWLERFGARPFDFDRGLTDAELAATPPPGLHLIEGTNFFRGLALIDLAEAMLKRAFGEDSVAVRVNAAGQGDFFQVHVDTHRAEVPMVKEFLRRAFYRRFDLSPEQDFVEGSPRRPRRRRPARPLRPTAQPRRSPWLGGLSGDRAAGARPREVQGYVPQPTRRRRERAAREPRVRP